MRLLERYLTKRTLIEEIEVRCPMEEREAVLQELHANGWVSRAFGSSDGEFVFKYYREVVPDV